MPQEFSYEELIKMGAQPVDQEFSFEELQGMGATEVSEKPRSIFRKAGGFLGDITGVTGVARGFGEAAKIAKAGLTGQPIPAPSISPRRFAGSAAKLGATVAGGLAAAPATIAGRVVLGAGLGATFGGGEALEKEKPIGGVAKEAAIGAGIGAGTVGAFEGIKYAVKGVPKLLSYFSDTPEEVLQRQFDNPELAAKTLKQVKVSGATGVLDDVQNAAKILRKNLTQQWQEGAKVVINNNVGGRVGFTQNEIGKLQRVAGDFGIDLPQNLSKVSVKEALELNKEINELFSKRAIRESAQGVIVRKTKELVSDKLSKFSGVKEFMSNYAGEKQVLDAISDIVKPYADSPITKSTALARIKAIFNENRPAFLSAVKDLEDSVGIPLLDKAATLSILRKAPISGQRLFSQFAEALFFPLTSPRFAALESRVAGRFGKLPAIQPVRTLVGEGTRRLFRE